MKYIKLTPWFPLNINPKRVGIYQMQIPGFFENVYSRWSGEYWSCWDFYAKVAGMCQSKSFTIYEIDGVKWRGISK
jgi:hypothetical protein